MAESGLMGATATSQNETCALICEPAPASCARQASTPQPTDASHLRHARLQALHHTFQPPLVGRGSRSLILALSAQQLQRILQLLNIAEGF